MNKLQTLPLLALCGTMRTSPTFGIQFLMNIPPMHFLQRKILVLLHSGSKLRQNSLTRDQDRSTDKFGIYNVRRPRFSYGL